MYGICIGLISSLTCNKNAIPSSIAPPMADFSCTSFAVSILRDRILLRLLSKDHNKVATRIRKCPVFNCNSELEN